MSTAAPLRTSAMIASFADPGQKTTPAPFGHALVEAAQADDRIVGLTADLGKYTDMHIFAQAFPERYFQMGMAEQLLFGAAAGMAETGLMPVRVDVFGVRHPPRLRLHLPRHRRAGPQRQHRRRVARADHRLRAVAPGHRGRRDLPRHPRADHRRPLRLRRHRAGRAATGRAPRARPTCGCCAARCPPCSTSTTTPSNSARPRCCAAAPTWSSISSGLMTMRALQAADELAAHHVDAAVVHTPTLKPFDAETVLAEVDTDRLVVTLENHTVVGGLFETVAVGRGAAGLGKQDRAGRAARRVPRRGRAAHPARPLRAVDDADRRAPCWSIRLTHGYAQLSAAEAVDSEIDRGNDGHVRRTALAAAAGEDQPARTGAARAAPGHHHRAVAAGHASGRDGTVRRAADQPRHAARGHAATAAGRSDLGDR